MNTVFDLHNSLDSPDTEDVFQSLAKLDFRSVLSDPTNNSDDDALSPYELHKLTSGYWDTENLRNFLDENSHRLSMFLHLNIQCLAAKFNNLLILLHCLTNHCSPSCMPLIIALSETWLSEHDKDSFPVEGYHPLH